MNSSPETSQVTSQVTSKTSQVTSPEALLDGLDDSQREAATALEGPVRIIACAGAGKTRTITRRIAYACATGKWDPERVLAVTFSVKAAAEMRSRIEALGVSNVGCVSTFHSAALQQIRSVWNDVCSAQFPSIMNDSQQIIASALKRYPDFADMTLLQTRDILAEINWAKVSLIAPDDYLRVCASTHRLPPAGLEPQQFVDIYEAYETEKNAHNCIDFNDILLLCCHILRNFPEAANRIKQSIGWITVDEYQDVSPLQHELLRLWMGQNRDICVVGDPAQTIYSFAGANSYYLLSFPQEFAPLGADISLNTDYRSTERIVGLANRVLAASAHKKDYVKVKAVTKGGVRVSQQVFATDVEEALGVVEQIAKLVKSGAAHLGECAILTRTNAQQQVVCKALKAAKLPYRVRKDVGWQRNVLEDAQSYGAQGISDVFASSNISTVTVSTIHAVKGLEFAHVYVIGCSEGLIPFGSTADDSALEEERRLMYVAITRAEKTLHLSYASRKDSGTGMNRVPSRFLA
ncbi:MULTISPECIES: ATP-dependent helicase [Gardnerella]|uniref:ATP-dependent helicase n=1 Tax=Gardnerella TaxID=2701 RepID=UPI001571FA89|nr:ATP-dependent helicase [Gardnerella vaginalis]NSX45109.1 ATP-dependent helicase [Gardnerella vaginalis]